MTQTDTGKTATETPCLDMLVRPVDSARQQSGRKGALAGHANRRKRNAEYDALKASLESKADTPEKKALVLVLLADYVVVATAGFQLPASGYPVANQRPVSRKRLAAATARLVAGLWRLGALPRVRRGGRPHRCSPHPRGGLLRGPAPAPPAPPE